MAAEMPDLEPLLKRFADALAVVNSGLAPLAAEPAAAAAPTGGTATVDPGKARELAVLLEHNDMRAEAVVAELKAACGAGAPAWLLDAAKAIDGLDYAGALALIKQSGVAA